MNQEQALRALENVIDDYNRATGAISVPAEQASQSASALERLNSDLWHVYRATGAPYGETQEGMLRFCDALRRGTEEEQAALERILTDLRESFQNLPPEEH